MTAAAVRPATAARGDAAHPWEARIGAVRVLYGPGRLADLGGALAELLAERAEGAGTGPATGAPATEDHGPVLLVTDPGVRQAGHAETAVTSLTAAGFTVEVFDDVGENPTAHQVAAGASFAAPLGVAALVAVGGGSAMDCAKGINFLLSGGGRMEDYEGRGTARGPMLPSIGVPTTAGTGSDAQSFALISRTDDHRKMACGDERARFGTVVLDPALLATVPRTTAAATGFDAVSHAVESRVTTAGNPVSALLAREAWRLLDGALGAFLDDRADGGAAGPMLLGAHLAGAAIEQSMLGAAHACANPLTARFGTVHGIAVALMLPHVVRFNATAPDAAAGYGDLAAVAGLPGAADGEDPARSLANRLEALRAAAGLPARLSDLGVPAHALGELAEDAATQWTGRFNPRPLTVEDFGRLYEQSL